MKAICLGIYKNRALRGCSNHGISEYYDEILIVHERGFIEVNGDEENLCKLVTRVIGGKEYKHIEPVAEPNGVGWMSGGAVVYSSDSRFREISEYPLCLHDRTESQEMYDRYFD